MPPRLCLCCGSPDLNDTSTLILALSVQQLLFAFGWWMHARRIAPQREALRHWAAFCALSGVSLLLFTEVVRSAIPDLAQVIRNIGLVLGFVALHRGLLRFTGQPTRDAEHAGLLASYVVALIWLGTSVESGVARTVVVSATMSWLMLRSAHALYCGGRAEFGARALATVLLPLLVVGAAMLVRAAVVVMRPDAGAVSITRAAHFNVALLLTITVLLAVFQFALGFLVMRRMVAELEHLSSHDSLTRLYNRRAFELRAAHEITASERNGLPLGLLLVDIDHFKRVNDRFGHATGDSALRLVAERLAGAARRSDVLARLGGEEFGVLLPATDAAGIRQAAERLRLAVESEPMSCSDVRLPVTISIGASMRLTGEADAEAMLRRADQALYRAKAEGRNRTVFDTLAQVSDGDRPPEPALSAEQA